MTVTHTHLLEAASMELAPSAPPARIVSGEPRCSEFVIVDTGTLEIGIWEVTPGEFLSVKSGIGEVVQFISGAGSIEHPDGTISHIAPGVIVEFLPGWEGTWRVTETTRKFYSIYSAAS